MKRSLFVSSAFDNSDAIMLTMNFIIPDQNQKLRSLLDISEHGALTQPQKAMLQRLIHNRENNLDKDGCLVIPRLVQVASLAGT